MVTAPLPDPQGGCLPKDVRVVPGVDTGVRGGEDVAVHLTLTTAGTLPCRIEVDSGLLLVQLSTGGSPVWSTEQCPGAVPERTVVLRPGWSSSLDVVWPGLYGDRQCTGATRVAPPGAYAVEAAVYEGEPSRADFDLRPAVPVDDEDDGPRGHGHGDGQGDGQGDGHGDEGDGDEGDGTDPGVDYGGEDDASTGNHAGDPDHG